MGTTGNQDEWNRMTPEAESSGPSVGPVEELQLGRDDKLFRSHVVYEETDSYGPVTFTRTHFVWNAKRSFMRSVLGDHSIENDFLTVPWSEILAVEFELSNSILGPDRVIRVTWKIASGQSRTISLKIGKLPYFSPWIRAFGQVGLSPVGENPFSRSHLGGFLYEYGTTIWILFIALCSFAILKLSQNLREAMVFVGILIAVCSPGAILFWAWLRTRLPPKLSFRLEKQRTNDARG
ncbi:MAG: hypothetical protein JW818_11380 [Pirellulales bacterium]|nr:hypothetical protein [Pirellulales bacterium]